MEELRKQWITSEKEYREGEVFVYRQKFTASQVKKAVFYGTALGVYEAELNGTKIGSQMFAPGFSYYPRRVLYQTHEVTELLREGENTLTVYLGQGWYCGRFLCENQTQIYGEQPAVAWILELEDAAGSRRLVSDETVEELESPYEYAGEYDGEIYFADGRENVTGHASAYTKEAPFALEPTLTEVRLQDEMPVREATVHGDVTILDFGQNFAGIVEIDPSFLKNETITIRHGEILNADGSLYTANLRKAKATIVYHAGAEKKKYRPRFTYMGFRYMELSGAAYQPGMIRAYALHTEMKRTGYFSCENPLVQKLYENQVWGQKSNYVEVPTDCPQRDERMGYTGDGQVFALTGAYNFNTDAFWKNFLRDLELGQLDNTEGYVCATVPQTGPAGIGFISMLGWGNAVTILPEMMYRQFGDEEALPRQYESMKLFVEAEIRKMGKKNLWIGPSLGDWLAMGKGIAWQAMHNNPVSNAFIVHDLKVISETAERLGKREDAARYRRQLAATTDAYIKKFVSKNGIVAKDYQSAIMALNRPPEGELRNGSRKTLLPTSVKTGCRRDFCDEHLPLLGEAGEQKLAYDVLLQNCPWMYQVKWARRQPGSADA
ncbi:MAG: family 78 glycoside hydrolase catalytic domain [Roseburia hominis]